MTIQCRTGCGEQIIYESFIFPDGFQYFLPHNIDESIHNCVNLGEAWFLGGPYVDNQEYGKKGKLEPNDYWSGFIDLSMSSVLEGIYFDNLSNEEKGKNLHSYLKKMLMLFQMECLLFPSPLVSHEEGPNDDSANFPITTLINLAMIYEQLDDFKSAITARLIQDKFSNNQSQKILELFDKEKKTPIKKQEELLQLDITALDLREKYFRKIEQIIKSFIRKKYFNINEFQKDFPQIFLNANKERSNPTKHINRDHDDVIEFVSFGACVKILKDNKIDRNKKDWNILDWDIINHAYFIVNRRNEMAHYSDDKLEEAVPKNTKVLGYVFSKEILDYFEKIDYV